MFPVDAYNVFCFQLFNGVQHCGLWRAYDFTLQKFLILLQFRVICSSAVYAGVPMVRYPLKTHYFTLADSGRHSTSASDNSRYVQKKGKPLSKSIEAGEPCNLFSGRVKLCSREHNTTTAFAMPLFSHPSARAVVMRTLPPTIRPLSLYGKQRAA